MIFDVARHKFSEGLLTLVIFALVASVAVLVGGDVLPVVGGAPLRGFIDNLAVSYPVASAIALFPLLIYAGLRLARSTVRVGIYSASSLGVVALGAVAMFGCVVSTNYLYLAVVALLVAELLGRLLYCFGANVRVGYLFTAMLAVGAMPLVDNALIPLALVLPVIVMLLRGTLREVIIILFGLASPTLLYCYIIWLVGGDFDAAFWSIWNMAVSSQHEAIVAYLTLPRLIFLGVILFFDICSIISYFRVRVTLLDSARIVWRLLMLLQVMLVVLLVVMPISSPALVVALMLMMVIVLPQFFIGVSVPIATIAYLSFICASLSVLF